MYTLNWVYSRQESKSSPVEQSAACGEIRSLGVSWRMNINTNNLKIQHHHTNAAGIYTSLLKGEGLMWIKAKLVFVVDIFTPFCVVSVRRYRARPRHSPGSAVSRSDGVHLTGFWLKHTPLQPFPLYPYTVLSSGNVNKSLKCIALRICLVWAPEKRFYCPGAPVRELRFRFSVAGGAIYTHTHTHLHIHTHTLPYTTTWRCTRPITVDFPLTKSTMVIP